MYVSQKKSSTEAEYRSLATTACELKWRSYLFKDLQLPLSLLIPLRCDNQLAVHIVENVVFHERTKHLEIDFHLVRNQYKDDFLLPAHVTPLADVFIKPLIASTLFHCWSR
ncbi:hypothetical protein LIER_12156 [Lithospermum erythrorhizon]|uniref:Copia protein n=1 Tax=Lithospermum erythrorhizon TaxID=34254 RepID=A0AAV3PV00_LITER